MPAQLIERALAEWREGERLLRDLPRLDPDHETVRMAVIRLRETYQALTSTSAHSSDLLDRCRAQIDAAHEVIVMVEAKLDTDGGPD
jgi:hypothetical protein